MNKRAPFKLNRTPEGAILLQALAVFTEATAIHATVVQEHALLAEGVVDAIFELPGGKQFIVEVKRALTLATLGQAVAQLARFRKPGVLITEYVTQQMAERLKALNIPFIDTAGNIYMRLPNLLIYVIGRKPRALPLREKRVRALRPTGLKVIFALLCIPDLVDAPYREVATAAGAALGTVNWVFNDLKRLNYVRVTKARGRIFENRRGLMDKWAEGYVRELRPTLKPVRYHVARADWWKRENLTALDIWLGGEPAAAILTKHLRPQVITIYGNTYFPTLAKKVQALKDEHGNLEVLQKFWGFDTPRLDKRYPIVPPLLAYADLVATADARNLETAQIIRERFLDKT